MALSGFTARTWPWEMSFLEDLLSWVGALVWANKVGTVTFLDLAMDFEAHSKRPLPAAPQAEFRETALPLQERLGLGVLAREPGNVLGRIVADTRCRLIAKALDDSAVIQLSLPLGHLPSP